MKQLFPPSKCASLLLVAMLSGCNKQPESDPIAAQAEAVPATESSAQQDTGSNAPVQAGAGEYVEGVEEGAAEPLDAEALAEKGIYIQVEDGPRLGDRRIVKRQNDGPYAISCQIYNMAPVDFDGNKAPRWVSFGHRNRETEVRECQNAVNLQEYLDGTFTEELGSVEDMVATVRSKKGQPHKPNSRAHACGADGLVYDVTADGKSFLHKQTLQHPNKRCRDVREAGWYRSFTLDALLSIDGE